MNILTSCRVKRSIQTHLVEKYPSVHFQFCSDIDEAQSHLSEAEVLITYGEDLTDAHINEAEKLRWIMVISAGLDRMPFKAIAEKGILVTNVRGIHASPMAEYAIGMLLQAARQTKKLIANEEAHVWDRKVKMTEISSKTMLVAGTGAIGQEVARLAKAFRMKTIGISRSGRPAENFDEVHQHDKLLDLIPEADFVISILPSTNDTKHFFQEKHFNNMKDSAVFLNMGRGDVVDEAGLMKALQNEAFSHAILDVFEHEPLPENHPFWDMDNVTVTPHLSGISPQYQPRAFELFEQNLTAYLNKEKPLINEIDPRRGY